MFDPWIGKIPWRGKWQPTPVLFPGEFYGQRSLVGSRQWGPQEADTTEQLHFPFLPSANPSWGTRAEEWAPGCQCSRWDGSAVDCPGDQAERAAPSDRHGCCRPAAGSSPCLTILNRQTCYSICFIKYALRAAPKCWMVSDMPGMCCAGLPGSLRSVFDSNSAGFLTAAFENLAWKAHAIPINISEVFPYPDICIMLWVLKPSLLLKAGSPSIHWGSARIWHVLEKIIFQESKFGWLKWN